MVCPFCKEEIQEGALKCKHCGSMLVPVHENLDVKSGHVTESGKAEKKGNIGLPITSLVLGIWATLACLDDSPWDRDTSTGMLVVSLAALILGIACVVNQKRGRGMAIAGIVLGSIGLLGALGSFVK